MPAPTAEKIEKARQKAEQAKARLQALEAQASQEARKRDTRRKIILGGLLIDAAEKDETFARVVAALLQRIAREQDHKAFAGWAASPLPSSGVQPSPAASPSDAGQEPPTVQPPSRFVS